VPLQVEAGPIPLRSCVTLLQVEARHTRSLSSHCADRLAGQVPWCQGQLEGLREQDFADFLQSRFFCLAFLRSAGRFPGTGFGHLPRRDRRGQALKQAEEATEETWNVKVEVSAAPGFLEEESHLAMEMDHPVVVLKC